MAQNVRVLHVLGSLNAGGAESRIMDIYRHIDRSKVQFDFAIHTSEKCFFTDEVLELGGKIYTLPKFNGLNYFRYKNAWKSILKENNNSIIHGHMTTTAFIYLKLAKEMGFKKRIAHARNSNKDSYVKKLLSQLSRFYATDLFAVSKGAAISEFGNKHTQKDVRIFPNGIDYSKFKFSLNDRLKVRKDFKINIDTLLIIHVGRFHKQKNHKFLLKIFFEINKINNNSQLLLIGDGPLKEDIRKKAEELEIESRVHFLGIQKNVNQFMSASDIVIFPSLYEGLSGVLLEAQVNGLNIYTSILKDDEIDISGNYFYISLDKDAKFWAAKIVQNNKSINTLRSSVIVKEIYDIKNVVKHYVKLYKSIDS